MNHAARLVAVIVVLAGLGFVPQAVYGCPACKEAVASSGGNVAAGYFWSILFMLSMPFLLVGVYGLCFYRMCRNAARRRAQAPREAAGNRVDRLAGWRAG